MNDQILFNLINIHSTNSSIEFFIPTFVIIRSWLLEHDAVGKRDLRKFHVFDLNMFDGDLDKIAKCFGYDDFDGFDGFNRDNCIIDCTKRFLITLEMC